MAAPHSNAADGSVTQRYRVDAGPWRALPTNRVFYTGTLRRGPHQVAVRTASRAGATQIAFRWRVVPPARAAGLQSGGQGRAGIRRTWTAPATRCAGTGRSAGSRRCSAPGGGAVDIYDIDGFLTTPGRGHRDPRPRWQAETLAHPKAVCYLDLAWEDYRPDGTPAAGRLPGRHARATSTTAIPQERWVDLRQLDALKPMLRRAHRHVRAARGSTRSSWTTSTASTRRRRPASTSRPATRRTSWPAPTTRSTATG